MTTHNLTLTPNRSNKSTSMEFLGENKIAEQLSSPHGVDKIFVVPQGQHRDNNEKIFFNSQANNPPPGTRNFKQIVIKKANALPTAKQEEVLESRKINEIVKFFKKYPFITINNFQAAEKIFSYYFNGVKSSQKLAEKIIKLREEIDKNSFENDGFGKLVFNASLRPNQVKITLARTKLKDCNQYVSVNLNNSSEHEMIVFSQWNWKVKKEEIIRSKTKMNHRYNSKNSNSIDFDAQVWQAHNFAGIKRENYIKTLDCLERNSYTIPEFVSKVNKKNISNLIAKSFINKPFIKTDNMDTTFLNFKTNTSQSVEAKITKFATALVIRL